MIHIRVSTVRLAVYFQMELFIKTVICRQIIRTLSCLAVWLRTSGINTTHCWFVYQNGILYSVLNGGNNSYDYSVVLAD